MITKRSFITILVGVNLILLAALLMQIFSLPTVYAQSAGRRGDFVCITAKAAGQSYDVLYLLDVPAHKLHALVPMNPQTDQLIPVPARDLRKDFDRK